MFHHKLRKEDLPLARFILVNAQKNTLKHERNIHEILRFILFIVVGKEPYTSFAAIVQTPQGVSSAPLRADVDYGAISGRIIGDSVETVQKVLDVKYAHEAEHLRRPGSKSTHAPAFHLPEKLIIVMGDMEFLSWHIELYLERKGVLGDLTFEYMRKIMATHPWPGKTGSKDFFVDARISEKKFYPGNFNAYARAAGLSVGRFTTDELLKQLRESEDTSGES